MAAPAASSAQSPASLGILQSIGLGQNIQVRDDVANLLQDPNKFIVFIPPLVKYGYVGNSMYTGHDKFQPLTDSQLPGGLNTGNNTRTVNNILKDFETIVWESMAGLGMGLRGWNNDFKTNASARVDDVVGAQYASGGNGVASTNQWSTLPGTNAGRAMNWTMFPVVYKYQPPDNKASVEYTVIPFICIVTNFEHNKRTLADVPTTIPWLRVPVDQLTHPSCTGLFVDPTFLRTRGGRGSISNGLSIDDNYWSIMSAVNMCLPSDYSGNFYVTCQPFGAVEQMRSYQRQHSNSRLPTHELFAFSGASVGLAVAAATLGLESICYTGYLQPIKYGSILSNRAGGLADVFISSNIVEAVQDIDLKVGWAMATETPLIIPQLANYGNQSLEKYLIQIGVSMLRYFESITGVPHQRGDPVQRKPTWLADQMLFDTNQEMDAGTHTQRAGALARNLSWVGIMSDKNIIFNCTKLTLGESVVTQGTPVAVASNISDVMRLSMAYGFAFWAAQSGATRRLYTEAQRYQSSDAPDKVAVSRAIHELKLKASKAKSANGTRKKGGKGGTRVTSDASPAGVGGKRTINAAGVRVTPKGNSTGIRVAPKGNSTGIRRATSKVKQHAFDEIDPKENKSKLREFIKSDDHVMTARQRMALNAFNDRMEQHRALRSKAGVGKLPQSVGNYPKFGHPMAFNSQTHAPPSAPAGPGADEFDDWHALQMQDPDARAEFAQFVQQHAPLSVGSSLFAPPLQQQQFVAGQNDDDDYEDDDDSGDGKKNQKKATKGSPNATQQRRRVATSGTVTVSKATAARQQLQEEDRLRRLKKAQLIAEKRAPPGQVQGPGGTGSGQFKPRAGAQGQFGTPYDDIPEQFGGSASGIIGSALGNAFDGLRSAGGRVVKDAELGGSRFISGVRDVAKDIGRAGDYASSMLRRL